MTAVPSAPQVRAEVRAYYDSVGWSQIGEGLFQNARYEDRRASLQKLLAQRRITFDPWFYRHRQVTGTLILAGSLFILYFFGVELERAETAAGLARRFAYPQPLAEALLDAMVLSALLGALGAIVASLFILFRPSMMRGFEEGANQWLSLRKTLKPLEVPRDGLEVYVERHARQVGIFLMLGGLYTLMLLLAWLGR